MAMNTASFAAIRLDNWGLIQKRIICMRSVECSGGGETFSSEC
jgi:hypothetical protein